MGTETYPKKGQTTHKDFGTEKGGDFVPNHTGTEYQQVGSKTSYGAGSNMSASSYKMGSMSVSFASGGGKAMVTASYPKNEHQDDFATNAASAKQLGSPPDDMKPKPA